ncbi:winged helix-turn-helix domain-containing protein [Natronobeatus ordinarius]|uniref:winged helix-turn-helix domain-containing protein n=1 Tax=Natronobeatus ordinarius TaxID=2963433 RepID=UPI0020CBC282|nr:transcriptional regulator [Natronobeatus ordinarius]
MDLDKLVHQPTRLQIFAYLYRHGETAFPELVEALEVTEGNLSSHLGRMEDAGAVHVEKQFVDRKPQTTYELTDEGRELFEEHVAALESLIEGLSADDDG